MITHNPASFDVVISGDSGYTAVGCLSVTAAAALLSAVLLATERRADADKALLRILNCMLNSERLRPGRARSLVDKKDCW